jgi:hypothetical protein
MLMTAGEACPFGNAGKTTAAPAEGTPAVQLPGSPQLMPSPVPFQSQVSVPELSSSRCSSASRRGQVARRRKHDTRELADRRGTISREIDSGRFIEVHFPRGSSRDSTEELHPQGGASIRSTNPCRSLGLCEKIGAPEIGSDRHADGLPSPTNGRQRGGQRPVNSPWSQERAIAVNDCTPRKTPCHEKCLARCARSKARQGTR